MLLAAPDVEAVVAVDGEPVPVEAAAGADVRVADLTTTDLKPLLEGAGTVIHLAEAVGPDDERVAAANVDGARRLLEAAGDVGVGHVVVLSSASVYGAWATNPVPLTEDAVLRPTPAFDFAIHKAEVERLAAEWREQHPGTTVTLLRPAVMVGEGLESWLARALQAALLLRAGDDPPAQFVHVDDLCSAIELARRARLDGPFNVAPDGWVEGTQVRSLAGAPPRLPMPAAVTDRLASLTWRRRVGRMPPGIVPYTLHPWVVANDRLRAAGWEPKHSNEEAFVAANEGTPWSRLSPQRRQELALGVAAATIVGAAAGLTRLIRRHRPVRSSRRP